MPGEVTASEEEAVLAAEARIKRGLVLSLVVVALLLVGMIVLVVFLAVDAYGAAPEPSPAAVVVSLLRDAAIVVVGFESIVIGVLLIVLILQVRALVALLRDEIRPMLESVNETLSTVRGTTRFMSQKVVSPAIQLVGLLTGLRRVWKEVAGLVGPPRRGAGRR
jgi:amino acid transporter